MADSNFTFLGDGLWGCLLCGVVAHNRRLHREWCPVPATTPERPVTGKTIENHVTPRCERCQAILFEGQVHACG